MDRESILSLGEAYNQVLNENLRELLAGTPLGRPYTDKEREQIRQALKDNNKLIQNRQALERAISTDGGMTADQEAGRTDIPKVDPKTGITHFTDKNRPKGFHDIMVNGQKVRRYWNGETWKVDNDNGGMQIGRERPDDPRAQAIRQQSYGDWKFQANDGNRDLGDDINSGMNNIRQWMKDNWGIGPGRTDRLGQPVADDAPANDNERPNQGKDRALEVADAEMRGEDPSSVPDPRNPGGTANPNQGDGDGDGDGEKEEKPPEKKPEDEVTQTGPNSAGLTPMQQWAKRFPKLAAKVKPGQAGYDEIQKMNSPQSQARSSVTQTKVGDMNNAQNNVQQAFKNNQQMDKVSEPMRRAASKSKDFSDKMNQAGTPSMSRTPQQPQAPKPVKPMDRIDKATTGVKRLPGLPEEFDLDKVLDAMCEGLPEPKRNYLKDMDPYDPRRAPRDHAPGAPLPPADMRPGIPEFFRKAKKDVKKPGNVKKA